MKNHSTYWTVATTHGGEEDRAVANAERLGFETYLPRTGVLGPRGNVRRTIMFPRYVFVRVRDGWPVLRNTRGISHLLIADDKPIRMPSSEIEQLRAREDATGLVRLLPRFSRGDAVKIGENGGAFEGVCGIVEGMDARGRCLVLMKILGTQASGWFSEHTLVAA